MTDQTAPTIDQMIEWLNNVASEADGSDYGDKILHAIRAALAEKQANPIDIPEGCRIVQLMRYKRSGKADGYICDLMRESDDRLFSTNAYDTWQEAMSAAIKAAQREGK